MSNSGHINSSNQFGSLSKGSSRKAIVEYDRWWRIIMLSRIGRNPTNLATVTMLSLFNDRKVG